MSSMEDPIKMEKLEANIRFRREQSVRRTIRISIISILVISILSHYSWILYPSSLSSSQILHGFHYFHSTTLQSITSLRNTDKKVMFFLCNGILLFLIKDSGLIRLGSFADDHQYEIHELGSIEDGTGAIVVLDEEEEEELEEYVEYLELVVVDEEAKEVNEVPDEIMDKMYDEFIERFKRERKMEALQLVVV